MGTERHSNIAISKASLLCFVKINKKYTNLFLINQTVQLNLYSISCILMFPHIRGLIQGAGLLIYLDNIAE